MKIGALVRVIEENGPDTAQNIGKIGVIIHTINEQEVEVEIFHNDGLAPICEPWIYFEKQLEILNENL